MVDASYAPLPVRPLVSVILCTYSPGRYEDFRDSVESILQQTYAPLELVVVVDGSDEVWTRVQGEYGDREDIVLHHNDRNKGLLESRNTGVDLATGTIVAFIDDDAVADDRWIEEFVETYQEEEAIAVGGQMVPLWLNGRPSHLPEEFYFLVGATHRGFADGPGEVRNTFGSNLSFRMSVFSRLHGFNPAMGGRQGGRHLQGGETELCTRMHVEYGVGVCYNPNAVVFHKVFGYRTRPLWLLARAFWQGYSKRGMQVLVPGVTIEERTFLRRLLTEFVPMRLRGLLRQPTIEEFVALGALVVLTAAVGVGYAYGFVRFGLQQT